MNEAVILQIFILIFSVMIHEISHGLAALSFGDKTALYEGRLTLNPIKHLDWLGSIFLPLFLYIINAGFMIGWAKPVPYNPYNLKNRAIAEPLIALAGPTSNMLVATVFGLAIKAFPYFGVAMSPVIVNLINIFGLVALINISLAVFNLLPFPPLDGSKIIAALLPIRSRYAFLSFSEKYGFVVLLAMVMLLPNLMYPVISFLFTLITGLH